jgi:hypothetical protein
MSVSLSVFLCAGFGAFFQRFGGLLVADAAFFFSLLEFLLPLDYALSHNLRGEFLPDKFL